MISKNRALINLYNFYTIVLLLIAILFTGFRYGNIDHDYDSYLKWLTDVRENFSVYFFQGKDIGFITLYKVTSLFSNNIEYFFTLVATISIFAKFIFCRLSFNGKYLGVLLLLVFSRLYLVQEFTQVRVAIAMGIASCAVLYWCDDRRKTSIILILVSITFHLSVILIPFLYFIHYNFKSLDNKKILFSIPIIAFFLSPFSLDLMHFIGGERIDSYLNGTYAVKKVSLLSSYYLIRLVLFYFVLLFIYDLASKIERVFIYFLSCSLFLQAFLSWNDVFSLRFVEVLGLFDLAAIILPLKYLSTRLKYAYFLMLIIISFLFFYSSLKIVLPYDNYIFNII
ncbi:EpsG family protein [Photobacterium leiognathi]|nr:EpsG family protein [Photobacterium leiognathi]